MSLSRRDFLKLGGLTAVTLTASACSVIGREIAQSQLPLPLPPATAVSPHQPTDVLYRLLNRAGYGPRPGDLAQAQQMGLTTWLETQLQPETLDDTATDLFLRHLTFYHMDIDQLLIQDEQDAARELMWATAVRALYSRRQLYEALVEFWSDHFNIYLRKHQTMPFLKIIDDRDVIRPHALGTFPHLLAASLHSPAMLLYLDNTRNVKGQPNENYARELLELHTLGVHAGYTQQDVQELARALTGWTVGRRGRWQGKLRSLPEEHDDDAKHLLGQTLPAGQGVEADVAQVLTILTTHPATAQFIATKLVRRFVADDPPAALVARVADTFQATAGDIKAMLRVIFLSDEFASPLTPPKLKRPFTFLVSALRAVGADVTFSRQLSLWLNRLGQPLFLWPPPDGYPDIADSWAANLLPRWNFALAALSHQIRGITVPIETLLPSAGGDNLPTQLALCSELVYGRALTPAEQDNFTRFIGSPQRPVETRRRLAEAMALMLASPPFQWA